MVGAQISYLKVSFKINMKGNQTVYPEVHFIGMVGSDTTLSLIDLTKTHGD